MEEILDCYTTRILAGDEKGANEMLSLLPDQFVELKELMGLVKELNLIYKPVKPSPWFKEKLFNLIRNRPSPIKAFAHWAYEHRQALAIGAVIAGSACSLAGVIAYFAKIKKAAA